VIEKQEECPRCGTRWGSQVEYALQECQICGYPGCKMPAVLPPGGLEKLVAGIVQRKLEAGKDHVDE